MQGVAVRYSFVGRGNERCLINSLNRNPDSRERLPVIKAVPILLPRRPLCRENLLQDVFLTREWRSLSQVPHRHVPAMALRRLRAIPQWIPRQVTGLCPDVLRMWWWTPVHQIPRQVMPWLGTCISSSLWHWCLPCFLLFLI